MKNNASAKWTGSGKTGYGTISTKTKVLENVRYSYQTRFEGAPGTNPEELIAAAHAACFAMKSAFVFNEAGFEPESLDVSCEIDFVGGKITLSTISIQARINGITKEKFNELVQDAGHNCPVSQLLKCEIKIEGHLL